MAETLTRPTTFEALVEALCASYLRAVQALFPGDTKPRWLAIGFEQTRFSLGYGLGPKDSELQKLHHLLDDFDADTFLDALPEAFEDHAHPLFTCVLGAVMPALEQEVRRVLQPSSRFELWVFDDHEAYTAPLASMPRFDFEEDEAEAAFREALKDFARTPKARTFLKKVVDGKFGSKDSFVEVARATWGRPAVPTSEKARRALFKAVEKRSEDVLAQLDAWAGDINVRDASERTLLHLAIDVEAGAKVVQTLLRKGADLHATDASGRTALHLALLRGNAQLVRQLLKAGLSPVAGDAQGVTPLHLAAGNPEALPLLDALLEHVTDVNVRAVDGQTPLHAAVPRYKALPIVRRLLQRGADVHGRGAGGATPLHLAANGGDADVIQALLAAGAPVDALDDHGLTPLVYACVHTMEWDDDEDSDFEAVRHLVAKGADPRVLVRRPKDFSLAFDISRASPLGDKTFARSRPLVDIVSPALREVLLGARAA
jgi:ankyrin repeat protein